MADVAQLVRALDCGSGGRRFESCQTPHVNDTVGIIFKKRLVDA